jgi:large subunit ribosomal protein L30
MSKTSLLTVTLKKSLIGRKPTHIQCAKGLGLRRLNHTVQVKNTPENLGMINKISYMVAVEEN